MAVGIRAENEYIHEKLRGSATSYEKVGQELLLEGDRRFDMIITEFADGTSRNLFFDITEVFGKS